MKRVIGLGLVFLAACGSAADPSSTSGDPGGGGTDGSPSGAPGGAPAEPGASGGGGGAGAGAGGGGTARAPIAPSCAREHGGQTCGAKGDEDCCTTSKQGAYTIDRYMVTAGRMRTFVESVKGDVRGWAAKLPAGQWNAQWNDELPTDIASANAALGPANKKACVQGSYTGHTYFTPPSGEDYSDFDRDTLDEKALNCVPWTMLKALCAFDGGHLATLDELRAAFTNGGTTKYPWGDDGLGNVNAPDPEERLNMEGGYETPNKPAKFRATDDGSPAEISYRIAPPGRFPKGNNKVGIADAAGNLLEWVGDQDRRFVWKADFEHHGANAVTFNGSIWWDARKNVPLGVGAGPWIWGDSQLYGNAGNAGEREGYYSIGGRCAH